MASQRRPARRRGFSLVELMVVLLIGTVLMSMAVPALSRVRDRRAVQNARDAYVWNAALARALAVERGRTVRLEYNAWGGVLTVRDGTETIRRVNFPVEYGATMQSSAGAIVVCYSPRGFAVQTSCSMNLPGEIRFNRGKEGAGVRVRALGQVERI